LEQKREEGQNAKDDPSNNEQNNQNGNNGFQNKNRSNPLPDRLNTINNHSNQITVPKRWNNYSMGIGRPLENTRFLPFKCPLGPEFFESRKNVKPFNVQTITEHVNGNTTI